MSHESESEWVRHVWEVNRISEGRRNVSEIVTYVFPCSGHPSKPHIGLLLRGLSVCSCCHYLLLVANTSVINYCFTSLALTWSPVSLIVTWSIPCMLRAVAAQVSLFVTGITLNFV